MKGKFELKESRGLPGGPNEQFTYVTGVFSTEGYKADSPDVNNPFNIIPSGNITMKGVDFPVMGTDNLGNSQMMMPGNNYQFPGDQVFEVPMARSGGGLLDKTMKCNNCGWSWKAADGGADVTTCHKCGGEALIKAQAGEETKPLFDSWYSRYAKATGNSTNPYDKEHYYDYESFFNDNINNPENLYPLDTRDWHLSSKYKKEGHPRLYEYPDGTYGKNYIEGAKDTREFQKGGNVSPLELNRIIIPPQSKRAYVIVDEWTPNLSTDWAANLKAEGKDSSYASRKQMYNDMGLDAKYGEYKGSANQNIAALNNYKNPTSNPVQTQLVQEEVISEQPKKEYSRYINIHGKDYGFNTKEEFFEIAKRKNMPKGWAEANVPKNLEFQTGGEYIVKSGDTFDGIANKKGINKDEFRKANPGISYDNIKINQKLNIPVVEKREPTSWGDYINPMNWGVYTYDDAGNFKQAFAKARRDKQDEFMWYGERYTTEYADELIKNNSTPSIPKEKKSKQLIFDEKFEKYKKDLIDQENSAKKGYDPEKKLWFPHEAPEEGGGFDIGYGHKIKRGEDFSKGLTNKQVNDLFERDIDTKFKAAKSTFNNRNLSRSWDELDQQEQILLTDYQYNGVLGEFKNFMKAVADKDKDLMLKEYVRYDDGVPLGKRNDWTKSYIETNLNYKTGGQLNDLKIYSDYINGNYDDIKFEKEAQKVYDKLNRIHYKNAKQFGMSAPNYIMTYFLKNPNG